MIVVLLTYLIIIFGSINLVRMAFFMVGSDLYGLQQTIAKRKGTAKPYTPTFTVVIPAHNEERTIIRSVDSALNAVYPENKLQIIVVDDGSNDSTVALVTERLKDARYARVQLVSQKNAGKAHALNNAIKNHATGTLVMCLDADSYIEPDALQNAARYFIDERVVALSSNVKIRYIGSLLSLIQQFEYLVCYQMKRAQTFFNIEYIIGGIGSTFRYSALQKVGFYDIDTITEDIDLTFKLIQPGNKESRVMYGSDVITHTEGVLDIRGLIRQRFRWKHGRSQTFLKHLNLFFSLDKRHNKFLTWLYLPFAVFCDIAFFLEPFLVAYIMYVVVFFLDWRTLLSAFIVVGTYVVLNVLAEDTIPWRQRIRLVFIAPSMYFFFYVLSFVEYVALIQSYSKVNKLISDDGSASCSWEHVERAPQKMSPVLR